MSRPRATRAAFRRRGRGTLLTIIMLLVGSAVLRIGLEANAALAQSTEPEDPGAQTEAAAGACSDMGDFDALIAELQAREARVASREAEIEDRMQALSVADAAIERRLEELASAEESLRDTITIVETAAEDDLDRLTAVYENMKPAEAAALFETMDAAFAAGFLGRMRPEAAAGIMAGLRPETAYTMSVMLAGRNAGAPRQ